MQIVFLGHICLQHDNLLCKHEFRIQLLYIVRCLIKQLLNAKLFKVFVIVMSHVYSTNDYSYLDIDNCTYQKTLLFNDSLSIFIIFINKSLYNLFLNFIDLWWIVSCG